MKKIDEIIYDEFLDITMCEYDWSWEHEFYIEQKNKFSEKLNDELKAEFNNICDLETHLDCLHLRELCKFAIDNIKDFLK